MPFCTRCGAQDTAEARFCASCGAPAADGTPSQERAPSSSDRGPSASAERFLRDRSITASLGRLVGGYVVAVVAAAVVCVICFFAGLTSGIGFIIGYLFFMGALRLGESVALNGADALDQARWRHFKAGIYLGAALVVAGAIWLDSLGDLPKFSDALGFTLAFACTIICGVILVAAFDRRDKSAICKRTSAFLDRAITEEWPYLTEVFGVTAGDTDSEPFWSDYFQELRRRGLHGVKMVISDATAGEEAAAKVFGAQWQTHEHYIKTEQPTRSVTTEAIVKTILVVSAPIAALRSERSVFPNAETAAWAVAERLSAQDTARKAGLDIATARY